MSSRKLAAVSRLESRASKGVDQRARPLDNFFTSGSLERHASKREDLGWISERLRSPSAYLIPVWGTRNLFSGGPEAQPVFVGAPGSEDLISAAESITFLGEMDGRSFFAVGLARENSESADALSALGELRDLKAMAPLLERDAGALLSHARAMVHWHRSNRFCGECGQPTEVAEAGYRRLCTNAECGRQHFPRTDPAIIVLVSRGQRCLLGRQRVWAQGFYSTIAGFVEPGESLEQAVAREVAEETGIRVAEVSYHSSQPWPFPGSIMLGFTALAASTAIALNDRELEDARWFARDDIEEAVRRGELRLPTSVSIAYRLIEDWFNADGNVLLSELLDSVGAPRGSGRS